MRFPFEIKYKKKLVGEICKYSNLEILQFVKTDFEKSGADTVKLLDDSVIVENRFFEIRIRPGLNWNKWNGISYAKFQIIENDGSRYVIYNYNLSRIIYICVFIAIIIGLITHLFWVGLIVFGVFGFINWLAKIIQHKANIDIILENFMIVQWQKSVRDI